MEEPNPYAAPSIPATPLAEPTPCWREGALLVTRHQARLPPRSIHSAAETYNYIFVEPSFKVRRRYQTQVKQFKLHIAVDFDYAQRRRWQIGILVALFVLPMVLTFITPLLVSEPWRGLAIMLVLPAYIAAFIYGGLVIGPPLKVARADERYVWLKGASEKFLATLPSWPPAEDH